MLTKDEDILPVQYADQRRSYPASAVCYRYDSWTFTPILLFSHKIFILIHIWDVEACTCVRTIVNQWTFLTERGIASLNCAHSIPLCSNWKIHRHNIYQNLWWETSAFRRGVAEVFTLLRCYAALVGSTHQRFGTFYRYHLQGSRNTRIQGDSKRSTQFRTSIFPELYMVCEWSI